MFKPGLEGSCPIFFLQDQTGRVAVKELDIEPKATAAIAPGSVGVGVVAPRFLHAHHKRRIKDQMHIAVMQLSECRIDLTNVIKAAAFMGFTRAEVWQLDFGPN